MSRIYSLIEITRIRKQSRDTLIMDFTRLIHACCNSEVHAEILYLTAGYLAGSHLPEKVLLGVETVADPNQITSGTSWFGNRCFELPKREVRF